MGHFLRQIYPLFPRQDDPLTFLQCLLSDASHFKLNYAAAVSWTKRRLPNQRSVLQPRVDLNLYMQIYIS